MSKRLLQPVGPVTRTVSEPRAGAEARHTVSPDARVFVPPGLRQAPVLDLMCSHFVLSLAARQGPRFNVRRDLNTLLALAGRHLIWPLTVLHRLRDFLERRCKGNELWSGFEKLSTAAFMERYGVWRGPYEEGTLFFYLDEYAKESPKDLLAVLAVTGDWLSQSLKKQSTLVEKNIDALAGLLQLNRAERALLLYGTLARYQRDLRSILVEFKVNNAPEAYAAIADVAGVKASEVGEALRAGSRLERIGMVENLISEHNITDLADLMKVSEKLPPVLMREYRDRHELMAVFTRPCAKSGLGPADFAFVQEDAQVLSALALHIDLPADYFVDKTDSGNSILRPIHYPPITTEDIPNVRAGAHRRQGRRFGENLRIRANAHFQVLRPHALGQQHFFEFGRFRGAWHHAAQVVANDRHHRLAHGFGAAGVATGLLLDHALQHAGHKRHACRFDRLQVAGRREPRLVGLALGFIAVGQGFGGAGQALGLA